MITVPTEKLNKCTKKCQELRDKRFVSAREVLRVAGLIMSFSFVFVDVTRLFTRNMYRFSLKRKTWDGKMPSDPAVQNELSFWFVALKDLEPKRLLNPQIIPEIMVYSDASSTGGATLLQLKN